MAEDKDSSFDPFEGAKPLVTFLDLGETKKYKFKDFDFHEALTLLPGWEMKPREVGPDKYSGWTLSKTLQTKDKATINVDVDGKKVYFCISLERGGFPYQISLENVNRVELKPKLKELIFVGKSGTYCIKNSIWHHLKSNDGKSRATITSY